VACSSGGPLTDIATGFLQAVSAFGATRLGRASDTAYQDAGSLMSSLVDGVPSSTKPAFDRLKADIEAAGDLVEPILKAIKTQTDLIAKMASEAIDDADSGDFTVETAARIATRIVTALMAMDEAVNIIAKELAKDAGGVVNETQRAALMGIWDPWAQPFKDLADGAGKLIDSLGSTLLGIDHAARELGQVLSFDRANFRLAAQLASTRQADFGVLRLNETRLEAFLTFKEREFVNPSAAQKLELVERDTKWYRPDEASFGFRIYTVIEPGLQQDTLLSAIMPGSTAPTTVKPTAVTLDTIDGFYLGDGQGAGNEKLVLPVQFNFPAVEIREVALGIVRNAAKDVTGLEITSVIAAKLGDAVGMQIGGAGVTIALDGQPPGSAIFPWDVAPRWPDAIGLRVKAGPITGGGYLERKVRTYGSGADAVQLVEFGGVIQLEILKVGVYAIGILSPDPFSLVLVMGVRFPAPIEITFGFTFNGVGGILALNRRVDSNELRKGMKDHVIDKLLFPDDPVAQAPTILEQLGKVFPPEDGGFVVGPIVELGWGSQAKIVEAKVGIVLSLPDPKLILLGAIKVQAPAKKAPLVDLRAEVYGEIDSDRLLVIASLKGSKIATFKVEGDLGLLIKWGGGGAFALTVGGFHPKYKEIPAELEGLDRLMIDLSPPAIVKIVVKAYFAVTAGAVMAGVRGDFEADIAVASARAWLQLDMIFRWAPRFGFEIDLELGVEIEVFGCSFAEISFRGVLEGTTPWKVHGTATVDVWWLPTFDFDLPTITWGDSPPAAEPEKSPLAIAAAALRPIEAWKAVLPLDGDLLVALGRVDVEGLVAHPLAALEVTQSIIPLETHIDRIGSAGVSANRVHLELPTTSAGEVGAVSTVTAPFAPGQFLQLEDEKLLSRSGFEDLPSGCRIAAALTPVSGMAHHGSVRWHTYYRDEPEGQVLEFHPGMFNQVLVTHGMVDRVVAGRENPYLSRAEKVNPRPDAKVSVRPAGVATVRLADDGTAVLGDLGVMTAAEAGRVADAVNASGAGVVTAVALGGI
jgi:hypothetical protein